MDDIRNLLEDLQGLIEADDRQGLAALLEPLRVQDVAELFSELDSDAPFDVLFGLLDHNRQVRTFAYIDLNLQPQILAAFSPERRRAIVGELDSDDRAALIDELEPPQAEELIANLPAEEREDTRELLAYDESSVGRLMNTDFVSVRPYWTIAEALDHIRAANENGESVNRIYVTQLEGKLLDNLPLRAFILGKLDEPVRTLMRREAISVRPEEHREEAVRLIQHYDLEALPVVDEDGVLLGTVTVDDVMDVAEEETTEDFHRLASVGAVELSMRDASVFYLFRKRVPWLVMLVFANIFSGAALAHYESTISSAIVLLFFLPLLIGSAGNAGSQSSTLMVRALATGDVSMRDWFSLLLKEFGVALALGIALGLAVAGLGVLRGGVAIGITVALTMVVAVMAGSLIGMSLPFAFSKLKLDPATASTPLITCIADISGIVIYFGIASLVLDLPG
ncbi:magnesium transporter [Pseudofulvimonas gallinarii]|jgi:magnesium transporter|uniref:Magnesium transporter MgtE n=1 Tax=Pseudofulvimonas gallinarii TaxID=634155 RepID=A0A4R3L538_9GAMM|nr:magnesium transporter [Pseudofulvimonas gallinarii]TCS94075.1 magnesium transporter [Pseudofulvimonas gallinarii]THD12988.1 magnesium transporter [Pseudofulvimonas gallinarii]